MNFSKLKLILIAIQFSLCIVVLYGCNPGCIMGASCLFAPGPTTNIRTNKYYIKHFTKKDTVLSTNYVYGITEKLNPSDGKYNYRDKWLLFYTNGLVLEQEYYLEKPDTDTIHTFTDHLKFACCHAWKIGSYIVTNDTLNFATKFGDENNWEYYKAKLYSDKLRIFEKLQGKKKDTLQTIYPKRVDRVVIKDIRI